MKRIDFYRKKEKLHHQMIEAICKILDEHMITIVNFDDLEINGGYACLAMDGPAIEYQVLKLEHTVGTYHLGIEVHDEWGNEIHANINDDVLNASFDTVYDAVYDLFYSKNYKLQRQMCHDSQPDKTGPI